MCTLVKGTLRHFVFFLFLLFSFHYANALESEKGFHLGLSSGLGVAFDDNQSNSSVAVNLGLETGYDVTKELDLLARFAYAPMAVKSRVGLPGLFSIYTFDFGVRYGPWHRRFSPYIFFLPGLYYVSSTGNGDNFIKSGFNFHTSEGIGFLYGLTQHNSLGLESAHQLFVNQRTNFQTLLFFNVVYRYTF